MNSRFRVRDPLDIIENVAVDVNMDMFTLTRQSSQYACLALPAIADCTLESTLHIAILPELLLLETFLLYLLTLAISLKRVCDDHESEHQLLGCVRVFISGLTSYKRDRHLSTAVPKARLGCFNTSMALTIVK